MKPGLIAYWRALFSIKPLENWLKEWDERVSTGLTPEERRKKENYEAAKRENRYGLFRD